MKNPKFLFAFVFLIMVSLICLNSSVLAAYNGNQKNQNNQVVAAVHAPPTLISTQVNAGVNSSDMINYIPVNSSHQLAGVAVNIGQNSALVGNWQSSEQANIAAQINLQNNNSTVNGNTTANPEISLLDDANLWLNNANNNNMLSSSTGQLETFYNHWLNSNAKNSGETSANITAAFFNDTGQLVILDNNIGQVEGSNYNTAYVNINRQTITNNAQLVNLVNIDATFTLVNTGPEGLNNEVQGETARSAPIAANNNYLTLNLTSAMTNIAGVNLQPPQINLII